MYLPTDLQEFLWYDRHEPYYAVHPTKLRRLPISKSDALKALGHGARYFGPVPRIAIGNKKEHCTPSFNGLYCDIDATEGLSREEILEWIELSLSHQGLDFFPSAVVYSGRRGAHCYWKLAEDIPIEQMETYNKALIKMLGADKACWDATRIFRNPGSIHEVSGKAAELISFNAQIWDNQFLELLGPVGLVTVPDRSHQGVTEPTQDPDREWLEAAASLDGWKERKLDLGDLPAIMKLYMADLPSKGWSRHGYASRSEMEQAIVYFLAGKGHGASDRQIIEIADKQFAKHKEERQRTGTHRYLTLSINAARRQHYEKGWITSPLGGYPRKRDAKYRHTDNRDMASALALARGQRVADWVAEIVGMGWSRASAYRIKDRLIQDRKIDISDKRINALSPVPVSES